MIRSAPPGRHADGNGLYLFVQPTGTRSWIQRLVIRGRRRELGLGAAALVPLAKAREQALANRMLARSGEVRLATWDEMDVAGGVWTISAERMKAKREHRVPLCGRAVKILEAARTLGDAGGLVFPMRSGKPIAMSTLPMVLREHGVAAVPHGFRSSFRDWAAERTDHPREVIEAALAHVVPNKGRRRMPAPTCSSGADGSWTTGRRIWTDARTTRRGANATPTALAVARSGADGIDAGRVPANEHGRLRSAVDSQDPAPLVRPPRQPISPSDLPREPQAGKPTAQRMGESIGRVCGTGRSYRSDRRTRVPVADDDDTQ